ncbi:MAG: outer membrane beta-barrel domain-containing protein, partial [Bacteriovoracaceae bacterium]
SFVCLVASFQIFAAEDNVYEFSWLDQDKEIYVLQNRKFRKNKKIYVGGLFGRQINGAFINSNEVSLHGGFFFKEDWGFEVNYTLASGSTNSTHDSVNEQGAAVAFYRKVDTSMSAMAIWAPFYAKINTFNKIFYYDWMFGAGVANVTTLDNRNEFDQASPDSDELTEDTTTAPTWMTNFRFYITQNWSAEMRIEGLHMNVEMVSEDVSNRDTSETRWNHYYDFKLGLNYTF